MRPTAAALHAPLPPLQSPVSHAAPAPLHRPQVRGLYLSQPRLLRLTPAQLAQRGQDLACSLNLRLEPVPNDEEGLREEEEQDDEGEQEREEQQQQQGGELAALVMACPEALLQWRGYAP